MIYCITYIIQHDIRTKLALVMSRDLRDIEFLASKLAYQSTLYFY